MIASLPGMDAFADHLLSDVLDIFNSSQGVTAGALHHEYKDGKENNLDSTFVKSSPEPPANDVSVGASHWLPVMQSQETMMQDVLAVEPSLTLDEFNVRTRLIQQQPTNDTNVELILCGSSDLANKVDGFAGFFNCAEVAGVNGLDNMDIIGQFENFLPRPQIGQPLHSARILDGGNGSENQGDLAIGLGQRAKADGVGFQDNWGGNSGSRCPHDYIPSAGSGSMSETSTVDQLMNIHTDEILGIQTAASIRIAATEQVPDGTSGRMASPYIINGLDYQYSLPSIVASTITPLKFASVKDVLKEKIYRKRQELGQKQLTVDFEEKPSYKLTVEEQNAVHQRKSLNRVSANRSRINRQQRRAYLKTANADSERINQMLMRQIDTLKQERNLLEYKWKLHQQLFHGAHGNRKPVAKMSTNDLLDPTEKNLSSNYKL